MSLLSQRQIISEHVGKTDTDQPRDTFFSGEQNRLDMWCDIMRPMVTLSSCFDLMLPPHQFYKTAVFKCQHVSTIPMWCRVHSNYWQKANCAFKSNLYQMSHHDRWEGITTRALVLMILELAQCHPVCMQREQLFVTAADYSMCSQQNTTPPGTICQEFCLIVTITVYHSELAG